MSSCILSGWDGTLVGFPMGEDFWIILWDRCHHIELGYTLILRGNMGLENQT